MPKVTRKISLLGTLESHGDERDDAIILSGTSTCCGILALSVASHFGDKKSHCIPEKWLLKSREKRTNDRARCDRRARGYTLIRISRPSRGDVQVGSVGEKLRETRRDSALRDGPSGLPPHCSVSRTRLSTERAVAAVRLASADSTGE